MRKHWRDREAEQKETHLVLAGPCAIPEGSYLAVSGVEFVMWNDWRLTTASAFIAASVSVIGIVPWTRWLGRSTETPPIALRIGRALGILGGLTVLFGVAVGVRAAMRATTRNQGPSGGALLWVGLSEAFRLNALGLAVATAGAVWLVFCTLRWRRENRAPFAVIVFALAASMSLNVALLWPHSDLSEPIILIREIQLAQEAYRTENHAYASISTALAANQNINHHTLYPHAPAEPGPHVRTWGVGCPTSACNAGSAWLMLPVHVDGPVAFGYSTIAGQAGERPNAVVTIGGKRVDWPVPEADWYIVTAVGDPQGRGVFTTILASSFTTQLLVDYGTK